MMKIAIIIPAYNEELTIEKCITQFHEAVPDAPMVVVDNNSSDRTYEIAKSCFARYGISGSIVQEWRQGKGIAIRTALLTIQADIYVVVDGDLTYPPSCLPEMLNPVLANEADIVVGDRISSGDYQKQNKRPFHSLGNRIVTGLINRLYKSNLEDVMSGYRVFNHRFASVLPLLYNGFELETEMTLFALDKRFRIKEIPIQYVDRPSLSFSKLNTFRDGSRVLRLILILFRDYKPLQFFGILSVLLLVAGLITGYMPIVEYIEHRYVYKVPSAILAAGLVILSFISLSTGLILNTIVGIDKRSFEIKIKNVRVQKNPYEY